MKLSLRSCRKGAVAIVSAITIPVLVGLTSLGVEVGHWYLVQRQMQGAADAAAISAAAQYIQDQFSTSYQTTGQQYAFTNGFTIPIANPCLWTPPPASNNCGTVLSLDARPIQC